MCKKTNYKDCNVRIDKCMREEIKDFNKALKLLSPYFAKEDTLKVVACCCGHEKYPKTMVLKTRGNKGENYVEPMYFEHFSGIVIPRTRNFYKRDSEGYYYIPEVSKEIIIDDDDDWTRKFIDSIENYRVNYLMSHMIISEITRMKVKSWLEFLNKKQKELEDKLKLKDNH